MDPYRIERLIYDVIVFAKRVDTHPLLPLRVDQFKRIVHEMEYVLEASEDLNLEDRDAHVYLAHLDTATGGWHKA